jgi:hypothetical protein
VQGPRSAAGGFQAVKRGIGEGGISYMYYRNIDKGSLFTSTVPAPLFYPSYTLLKIALAEERNLFVCAGPNLGGVSGSTSTLLVLYSGVLYLNDERDLLSVVVLTRVRIHMDPH